jgi:sulfoxide reductase catalytic subunit YedY
MTLLAVTWWLASPFTIRRPRVVQKVGEIMMWPFNALTEWWDPESQLAEKNISLFSGQTAPCRNRPNSTRL